MKVQIFREVQSVQRLHGSDARNLVLYACWNLNNETNEAQIGATKYAQLQNAIDAVAVGGSQTTIRILKDITVTKAYSIDTGQNIDFDFQNHTLLYEGKSNVVIIENKGSITVRNGTIRTSAPQGAINNRSGATLTVTGFNISTNTTRLQTGNLQ